MRNSVLLLCLSTLLSYTYGTFLRNNYLSREEVINRLRSQGNNVVDGVVEMLQKYAVQHNLEPMVLPDMHEEFKVDIFMITFKGKLDLSKGTLAHLTTMKRSGEANMVFEGTKVHIMTEVEFSDLIMHYNYKVAVMGMNPSGGLQGSANGLRLKVDLVADLDSYKTSLQSLSVINAAKITLKVDGNGIADEIVNAIAGLVKPYFEKDILAFIEEKMTNTLEEALVDFDIREILGF